MRDDSTLIPWCLKIVGRESVYLNQIGYIFLQFVDGVWTRSILHNGPFRIVAIDTDVIDKHVILVITLVAEGDIARLSLVCTQIDAYLRPCVGSIAR